MSCVISPSEVRADAAQRDGIKPLVTAEVALPPTPAVVDHLRFHLEHAHLTTAFGNDRFALGAEAFARLFGTPLFLGAQTAIVVAWIAVNAMGITHFDVYPFILLAALIRNLVIQCNRKFKSYHYKINRIYLISNNNCVNSVRGERQGSANKSAA